MNFCVSEKFCSTSLKVWNWAFSLTFAGAVLLSVVLYWFERRKRKIFNFDLMHSLLDKDQKPSEIVNPLEENNLFAEITKGSFA